MASYTPRPPLLPWASTTWSERWSRQGRMASAPVPRTPFLLLKAPVSTLYEEKFGGDRNMFTVAMYCGRMNARSIRIGLVIDCTSLDLEEFEPLPAAKAAVASSSANKFDRRVRYFHNPSEWDDYDVEYHRLLPPKSSEDGSSEPLAPQVLPEFYQVVSNYMQKSRANNSNTKTCIALFDSRGGLGAAAYLAAAYMCTKLRAPVHAAIEALKEGTPAQPGDDSGKKWGLCDVRLVKDLQQRFRGKKEIRLEGGTPSWWWAVEEEEEEEIDDAKQEGKMSEVGDTSKRKRSREEAVVIPPCESSVDDDTDTVKRARTDDITSNGDLYPNLPKETLEPVPKDSQKWTRAMAVLAQMTSSPSSPPNLVGMTKLPLKPEVEVTSSNSDVDLLQSIKGNPDKYKVTWLSTKGRRGLLLILSEAVYFIEQSTSSSLSISILANIEFPSPKDLSKSQHRTLLDVVLVKDTERGQSTYRFYALDILCIEGGMVWHKHFDHRWKYLNEGVLMPRKKDESQPTTNHAYAKEPIKIRAKEYFPMSKLGFVMKDVCAGVGHEAEGVRVVPMGEYGIGGEEKDSTKAVIWKRGCDVDEEQLKSMLLAS